MQGWREKEGRRRYRRREGGRGEGSKKERKEWGG